MTTGDVRVLSIVYDSNGERFRDFGDAVQYLEEVVWPDSPLKGPVTILWVLKFMKTHGGTKLQDADGGMMIHEVAAGYWRSWSATTSSTQALWPQQK